MFADRFYTSVGLVFSLLFLAHICHAVGIKVDSIPVNVSTGGTGMWVPVVFPTEFNSIPAVFVSPTSDNSEPASVRIRNVSTAGFELLLVEAPGGDGSTESMQVDYFAAELGAYTFAGATRMEVGLHSTVSQQGSYISPNAWDDIEFANTYSDPLVITQIQSINSEPDMAPGVITQPWLEVAVENVSSTDMQLALERSETSTGSVTSESIAYLVMDSGSTVSIAGETLHAKRSGQNIEGWSEGCHSTDFDTGFSAAPLVIASQNTRSGDNGGWVRRCALSSSAVGLTIDEDVSFDTDRSHVAEDVGIFAISSAFTGNRNGKRLAAGQATIPAAYNDAVWTSVVFSTPFEVAPFVFSLNGPDEFSPSELRLKNLTNTGFDIAVFKPRDEVGAAVETQIDYVAVIEGKYALSNGDLIEVGSVQTQKTQGDLGANGWESISFDTNFTRAPALLTQIQTINNEPDLLPALNSAPWLATAVRNLDAGSFELALETAEATAGTVSLPETIAYFAAEDGANGQILLDGGGVIDYEMLLSSDSIQGFEDGCYLSSFSESYLSPIVIASQVSRDGNDGGWVRRCSLSGSSLGLFVDEDVSGDSERNHTSEQAGIFVFSEPFEAEILLTEHYQIEHSGSAITCAAEAITIRAHSAYHEAVVNTNITVRVSANSSSVGWNASDVSWSLKSGGGSLTSVNSNTVDYTFDGSESEFELWLSNTSVADIDIDIVDLGDTGITDKGDGLDEDALLSFKDAGLRFYADLDSDGDADGLDSIPSPLNAGNVSSPFVLKAVKTDLNTGACTARVTGSQTVQLAYECVDPTSCIRDKDMLINGMAIEDNNLNQLSRFTDLALVFDEEGETPLNLQYFDVGLLSIYAELILPASANDPEIELSGQATITVKPDDFVITRIENADGDLNPGTAFSGEGFAEAGAPVTVTVEVQGSTGLVAPNYGNEISAEGITLSINGLVMPTGGDVGSVVSADQFSVGSKAGEFINSLFRWDQVGSMRLRAYVADGDYLAEGDVEGSVSDVVGRFYPALFAVSSSSLIDACITGGFSYMSDQLPTRYNIPLAYQVDALTALGNTPSNYDSSLAYPVSTLSLEAENENNGIDLTQRIVAKSPEWLAGVLSLSADDNLVFKRLLSQSKESVDGPYANLKLGLKVSDDALDPTNFESENLSMNASTSGDCTVDQSCTSRLLNGSINAVFGRLNAASAFGPETASLNVFLGVEYWDGEAFVVNTADSCTALSAGDLAFASQALSLDSNRVVALGAGSTEGTFTALNPGIDISLISGDAGLSFSAPGYTNTGQFSISVDLAEMPWLRFDWNQDGDSANDTTLPNAEINFGSYRGHDRIIFWSEVLSN